MLHFLLRLLQPFQMFIQRVGYVEPRFSEEEIETLISEIEPGDTLGSFEQLRITSLFIAGQYDHVAIVTNNRDVIEAVGDVWVDKQGKRLSVLMTYVYRLFKKPMTNLGGIRRVGLRAWLYRKHDIFLARHYSKTIAAIASKHANTLQGSYDYSHDDENEMYNCVELVRECYRAGDKSFMAGTHQPLPIHFMFDKHLSLIYDSKRIKV